MDRDAHITLYSRFQPAGNYFSHQHAAYTAMAYDIVGQHCPDALSETAEPFLKGSELKSSLETDTLVNAAAMHHRPQTLLQWIIATADRVASGFERENFDLPESKERDNYLSERLLTLFEQIDLNKTDHVYAESELHYRYPLLAASVQSIFPAPRQSIEPENRDKAVKEYRQLWDRFSQFGHLIPEAMQHDWPLWLDSFDSAWLAYTQAIPAATYGNVKSDVSLYDHSKSTAAFATALWRWTEESGEAPEESLKALQNKADWDKGKFLIVQGDFFGIQNFIFSEGSRTNKQAAKILRGRSFYVSLLTELAALRVLEALELPPTSQITNAAGKFMIVAPNTPATVEKLRALRREFNRWFIEHMYATSGLGLAWTPISCQDLTQGKFKETLDRLFQDELGIAKLQRFNLAESDAPDILPADYAHGVCDWHGQWPADKVDVENQASCAISRDEIAIGEALVKKSMLAVFRDRGEEPRHGDSETGIFGYRYQFVNSLAEVADTDSLVRLWDFSLPSDETEVLWKGYARRNIAGYVPHFEPRSSLQANPVYDTLDKSEAWEGNVKMFNFLACDDRTVTDDGNVKGIQALCALKGDIDNLGLIFRAGLIDPLRLDKRSLNFAKMAGLSRQVNAFFTVYVPYLCKHRFPSMYTIFAGGDDFFLIGPWHQAQRFALAINQAFGRYVAFNSQVHFSAGLSIVKPNTPIRILADMTEEALAGAKSAGKNKVALYGNLVNWTDFEELLKKEEELKALCKDFPISSAYLYSLFEILEKSQRINDPEAMIWRSQLYYKTHRFVSQNRGLAKELRAAMESRLRTAIFDAIEKYKGAFRIPLTNLFYFNRQ